MPEAVIGVIHGPVESGISVSSAVLIPEETETQWYLNVDVVWMNHTIHAVIPVPMPMEEQANIYDLVVVGDNPELATIGVEIPTCRDKTHWAVDQTIMVKEE
jgi:hypothetical protein